MLKGGITEKVVNSKWRGSLIWPGFFTFVPRNLHYVFEMREHFGNHSRTHEAFLIDAGVQISVSTRYRDKMICR